MLRECRKKLNLTQAEVAKMANISLITYKRYEYGNRKPDIDTAFKIASILQTTVEQLWGGSLTTA